LSKIGDGRMGEWGDKGKLIPGLLIPHSASYALCPMPKCIFIFGTKSQPLLSFNKCCMANKILYIAATNTSYTKI
jgi:hypothetical protein